MEKTIIELFAARVVTELKSALAAAQSSDPKTNAAMLKFNVAEVLKTLGASRVRGSVRINKDYTWLTIEAAKDGFYHNIDFAQRHQAKKAELATMRTLENVPLAEAVCVAGIHANGENGFDFSMKWEELITEDGEGIAYTGPVRKWHEDTQSYDGPVCNE